MYREIHFKILKKLLKKSRLDCITIDIGLLDINLYHLFQESKHVYESRYKEKSISLQKKFYFVFCEELKSYITGFPMIQNISDEDNLINLFNDIYRNLKFENLEILLKIRGNYFNDKLIDSIESLNFKYIINCDTSPLIISKIIKKEPAFLKNLKGVDTADFYLLLNDWKIERRLIANRFLKKQTSCDQIIYLKGHEYDYSIFITNTNLSSEKIVSLFISKVNPTFYLNELKHKASLGYKILENLMYIDVS